MKSWVDAQLDDPKVARAAFEEALKEYTATQEENRRLRDALARVAIGCSETPDEAFETGYDQATREVLEEVKAADKAHENMLAELKKEDKEQWAKAVSGTSGRKR